ncbi:MAG: hypothetical protein Edafosvirus3_64 [Edafosvirus sp.]|uniref:Right handed beta helix domain-containing protein n=1 Tax=Edafosvirus sp. TaxID=2487765 RepID=A0A3G4ZSW0_9VIRU|nr:MAG: hypothetical protein Edafosvirus3_64 [Edafosvirus sp.]
MDQNFYKKFSAKQQNSIMEFMQRYIQNDNKENVKPTGNLSAKLTANDLVHMERNFIKSAFNMDITKPKKVNKVLTLNDVKTKEDVLNPTSNSKRRGRGNDIDNDPDNDVCPRVDDMSNSRRKLRESIKLNAPCCACGSCPINKPCKNNVICTADDCKKVTIISQENVSKLAGYTITKPGSYCLASDIIFDPIIDNIAVITIATDNVYLDLNNHNIILKSKNKFNISGIVIAGGSEDITIIGGGISGFITFGILINPNSENIKISDIYISDIGSQTFVGPVGGGIYANGVTGLTIEYSSVTDSSINTGTLAGIGVSNCDVVTMENCYCKNLTNGNGNIGGFLADGCNEVRYLICTTYELTTSNGTLIGVGFMGHLSTSIYFERNCSLDNLVHGSGTLIAVGGINGNIVRIYDSITNNNTNENGDLIGVGGENLEEVFMTNIISTDNTNTNGFLFASGVINSSNVYIGAAAVSNNQTTDGILMGIGIFLSKNVTIDEAISSQYTATFSDNTALALTSGIGILVSSGVTLSDSKVNNSGTGQLSSNIYGVLSFIVDNVVIDTVNTSNFNTSCYSAIGIFCLITFACKLSQNIVSFVNSDGETASGVSLLMVNDARLNGCKVSNITATDPSFGQCSGFANASTSTVVFSDCMSSANRVIGTGLAVGFGWAPSFISDTSDGTIWRNCIAQDNFIGFDLFNQGGATLLNSISQNNISAGVLNGGDRTIQNKICTGLDPDITLITNNANKILFNGNTVQHNEVVGFQDDIGDNSVYIGNTAYNNGGLVSNNYQGIPVATPMVTWTIGSPPSLPSPPSTIGSGLLNYDIIAPP